MTKAAKGILDLKRLLGREKSVQWIHPSYRDLVIDELARDASLRLRFLKMADLQGVQIALSQAGGARGERRLPLLRDHQSWQVLRLRCIEVVDRSGPDEIVAILRVLRSAAADAGKTDLGRIAGIVSDCCDHARQKWNRQKTILTEVQLHEFFDASVIADPLPVAPAVAPSWMRAHRDLRASIQDRKGALDGIALLEWARLTALIAENEPRYLKQVDFPKAYVGDLTQLLEVVREECGFEPPTDDADEVLSDKNRMSSIAKGLDVLRKLFPSQSSEIREVRDEAASYEDRLRELYHELSAEPDTYDYEPAETESRSQPEFDIQMLFSDL